MSDPKVRKSEALARLTTIKQKDSQSVRDLLSEIEILENDIPPMIEKEREA